MATDPSQYYQSLLDAKKKASSPGFGKLSQAEKNAVYAQSNAARDALKNIGVDTSSGYWAKGTDFFTADKGYLTDQAQKNTNSMYDQLQSAQLGQLHASQQAATNRLNQQKTEYGQQITGQKNQADVVAQQKANALREIMTRNGLNASGENVTANVALQNSRQSALNGLDQQFNNYSRDIANQIAAINDPTKEQAIIAQLGAQRAQALAQAQQTAFNQAMQESNTAWNQNFQQSQANQAQSNWESEQARRAYEYSHMSAAQKAQFDQNAAQFGQQMAWNLWNTQYQGNMQQSMLNAQLNSFNDTSGGGDYNNYKMMPQAQKSPNYRNFVQDLSSAIKKTGVPESWYTPLAELVGRESSWNPSAKNPSSTAHGYAQFLDSTVKNYSKYGNYNNPVDQLVMMMHYIKDRYGSPQAALKFWDANHYY